MSKSSSGPARCHYPRWSSFVVEGRSARGFNHQSSSVGEISVNLAPGQRDRPGVVVVSGITKVEKKSCIRRSRSRPASRGNARHSEHRLRARRSSSSRRVRHLPHPRGAVEACPPDHHYSRPALGRDRRLLLLMAVSVDLSVIAIVGPHTAIGIVKRTHHAGRFCPARRTQPKGLTAEERSTRCILRFGRIMNDHDGGAAVGVCR